jgi:hypothetical protein
LDGALRAPVRTVAHCARTFLRPTTLKRRAARVRRHPPFFYFPALRAMSAGNSFMIRLRMNIGAKP